MGYALGLAQITAAGLGTVWFYEGGTLGFRTLLHVYVPEPGLIMAMGLNSAPAEDQIDVLMTSVYSTLVEQGAVPAPATVVGAGA
jgi:D-alanyl-D-alanine carboxypeptidase